MSTELAALVGESYERAYSDMVRVQQLTELEEVIDYKEAMARCGNCGAGVKLGRGMWLLCTLRQVLHQDMVGQHSNSILGQEEVVDLTSDGWKSAEQRLV